MNFKLLDRIKILEEPSKGPLIIDKNPLTSNAGDLRYIQYMHGATISNEEIVIQHVCGAITTVPAAPRAAGSKVKDERNL